MMTKEKTGDEVAEILGRTSIFGGLDGRVLADLAATCAARTYERGEFVCCQGDPGDRLFIIGSGLVKVVFTSLAGDEFLLATSGPGEVLGEVALLDGVPRSASVIAVRRATVYALSRATLSALMRTQPLVFDAVMSSLGSLVRRLTEQTGELAFLDLGNRLARVLLRLAGEPVPAAGRPVVLDLGLSQAEIGTMIGASRPAVNRALQLLAMEGAIRISGQVITVSDVDALRRAAAAE